MLLILFAVLSIFNKLINCFEDNVNNVNKKSPHIIFILADDLGWNDVGFHGSDEIATPNIDALAYNGVILKNHYSETLCSPSRAALLTGKYPIHTGMQHNVVLETQASGLPLNEKIFPQYLKPLGYKTHAVGKWHLGFYKKEYTPPYRGFDSFYGLWNGYHDYYRHNVQAWFIPYDGYDMRRNTTTDWSAYGKYTTDLFTDEAVNIIENHDLSAPLFLYLAHLAPHAGTYEDPLQAPEEEIDKFSYIENYDRRRYAAMVSKLDESVGKVMEALKAKSMLENSIVVFVSDNGAPTAGLMKNYGSNWPLKGEKSTPWEGGVKTVALVWSKLLQRTKKVNSQLMHISDWLPTLYYAAGGDDSSLENIDGTNLWNVLSGTQEEYTNYTILHNIDERNGHGYAALREGSFKLVNGTSLLGYLDMWSGNPEETVPEYDTVKVLYSKTNQVLANLTHLPLTNADILTLRNFTKISCKLKNNTKHLRPCLPRKRPCLFNIAEDPCERYNLYDSGEDMKSIQNDLENKINQFRKTMVNFKADIGNELSNPALYNNTWANWGDIEELYSVIGA